MWVGQGNKELREDTAAGIRDGTGKASQSGVLAWRGGGRDGTEVHRRGDSRIISVHTINKITTRENGQLVISLAIVYF